MHLSHNIHTHDVPISFILNADEACTRFAPQQTFTFAMKGTRRVKCIEVGREKAALTTTVTVTADGSILPIQLIFKGESKRS